MGGHYLNMFLQSLADSNQMALAQQAAVRQQQELELEKQKQQNTQQLGLADLLSQGATIAPPAGTAPTEMSAMSGLSLTDPSIGSDPSRTISYGGKQLQIESPDVRAASDTARAVSRATAINKIGKVPLTAEGSSAMDGMLPAGTPIDPAHAGYLGTIVAANKRAESAQNKLDAQPDKKLVGHSITTDDSGKQSAVKFFSDGTTTVEPLSSRGQTRQYADGSERGMTANEHAVHKQQAIEDYRRALTEEGKLSTERLRLGAALKTGQHYIAANGGLHPFNRTTVNEKGDKEDPKGQSPDEVRGMKDDMRQRYDEVTTQLQSIIAQKNDAIERAGGHPSVSTDEAIANLRAGHVHNMNVALNNPEPAMPPPQATPNAGGPMLPKTAASAKPAATVGAKKFSVGQTIQYKGKPHIVKGINPDGSLQIAPAGS